MEQITINLLATGVTPVCHVSQFDDGRTIRINLKKGAEVYTLSGTEEVKMRIRKPDNTERVVNITNTASSYVDYVSTPEDCDIEGVNVCELVIDDLGSKNFLMNVEEDAYGGGADVETLTASGPIVTFETNMVDNLVDLKAEITPIQDLHGYDNPWPAGGGANKITVNRTKGTLSGYYPSSVRQFEYDKYYIGLSANNYYDESTILEHSIGDNVVSLKTRRNSYGIAFPIKVQPNTNYYIGATLTGTAKMQCSWFDADGNYLSYLANISVPRVVTTPENCYTMVFIVYDGSASDTTISASNAFVNLPSTVTEYTPYSNICPITGHAEAKIVRAGKNLWDKNRSDAQNGYYFLTGEFHPDNAYRCLSFPCNPGDKFIKSGTGWGGIVTFWNGSTFVSGVNSSSITVPLGANIVKFACQYSSTDAQLELGSAATEYEPYAGAEVTVQFGQTVYKGYLDAKNSKVIATHVLGNFDGSNDEAWNDYPAGNGFFVSGLSDHIKESYGDGLCNILPTSKSLNNLGVVYGINSFHIFIMQVKTAWNISTVSDLRTFLASNPLQIMYKLAEPIEIPLSAISQFETLLGINNVYADIGDVELKYLKQV